jgi:hypothetical protein
MRGAAHQREALNSQQRANDSARTIASERQRERQRAKSSAPSIDGALLDVVADQIRFAAARVRRV